MLPYQLENILRTFVDGCKASKHALVFPNIYVKPGKYLTAVMLRRHEEKFKKQRVLV